MNTEQSLQEQLKIALTNLDFALTGKWHQCMSYREHIEALMNWWIEDQW